MVSRGDFSSYSMPRQTMRREQAAASALPAKRAEAKGHNSKCQTRPRLVASPNARLTACPRQCAFKLPSAYKASNANAIAKHDWPRQARQAANSQPPKNASVKSELLTKTKTHRFGA